MKHTDFRSTSTGPIAKINGTWYSVNGTTHDIVDIRYELTQRELSQHGVTNDHPASNELQLLDQAIEALGRLHTFYVEHLVDHQHLNNILMSVHPLIERRAHLTH